MGFWRHSNGTRSLTHSLTRFSTLLSITFVPSPFDAYVWHILERTSKAYIFSRRQRSRRWVLYKWKYSKEHWQYHRQEMDLGSLKGRWNNWAWIIVVYLDELCTFTLFNGEDAIDRSVKELSQPDDGISLSEKRIISQRALAAEKWSSIKATLRSIYCGLILFGQFCLNSVKRWSLPSRLFVGDSIYLQEMLRWNKQVSRILKYRRAIGYLSILRLR